MDIITLEQAITANGRYNDRLTSPELTDEVKKNLKELLKKINNLLNELGIKSVDVTSGFRPSGVNASIGGAKKSNHMTGHACDLGDIDGKLDELFEKNIKVLENHGLFLESPKSTKGWAHLQDIKTHNNPFIP